MKRLLLIAAIALAAAQPASAQGRDGVMRSDHPEVGERIPDIEIFDENGEPISLRQVAGGHYTVIVFGCLT